MMLNTKSARKRLHFGWRTLVLYSHSRDGKTQNSGNSGPGGRPFPNGEDDLDDLAQKKSPATCRGPDARLANQLAANQLVRVGDRAPAEASKELNRVLFVQVLALDNRLHRRLTQAGNPETEKRPQFLGLVGL